MKELRVLSCVQILHVLRLELVQDLALLLQALPLPLGHFVCILHFDLTDTLSLVVGNFLIAVVVDLLHFRDQFLYIRVLKIGKILLHVIVGLFLVLGSRVEAHCLLGGLCGVEVELLVAL